MVATVIINRLTGAGPTLTPITGLNTRANAVDSHTVADTADPIEIPSSPGTNYSFWVNTQLETTVAPDTLIDNIEWFTDGGNSYGTGITCVVAQAAEASYTQAVGSQGVTGTVLNDTNYTGGTLTPATPTDVFAFVTGSPLAVTGSTSIIETFGSIVVYQVEVDETAAQGLAPGSPETWTWRFDES